MLRNSSPSLLTKNLIKIIKWQILKVVGRCYKFLILCRAVWVFCELFERKTTKLVTVGFGLNFGEVIWDSCWHSPDKQSKSYQLFTIPAELVGGFQAIRKVLCLVSADSVRSRIIQQLEGKRFGVKLFNYFMENPQVGYKTFRLEHDKLSPKRSFSLLCFKTMN